MTNHLDTAARVPSGNILLQGLIGGLGIGVLNVILYLFFVLPMVAHIFFHTYMHYGETALAYSAGCVGILGLLGMPAALLIDRTLAKRSGGVADPRDGLLRQEPTL